MDNTVQPDKSEGIAIVPELVKPVDIESYGIVVHPKPLESMISEVSDKPVEPVPVEAVPCEIKAREDNNIKTVVPDKPISLKYSLFCEYVVKHGLTPIDAYCKVHPKCKRVTAYHGVERLLKNSQVKAELDRLRNANNPNKQESIDKLHNKAVETLESIMTNSDKDSVRLGAVNAIINRTVPVINKSMHVGVKVTREEIDRRYNALQE